MCKGDSSLCSCQITTFIYILDTNVCTYMYLHCIAMIIIKHIKLLWINDSVNALDSYSLTHLVHKPWNWSWSQLGWGYGAEEATVRQVATTPTTINRRSFILFKFLCDFQIANNYQSYCWCRSTWWSLELLDGWWEILLLRINLYLYP